MVPGGSHLGRGVRLGRTRRAGTEAAAPRTPLRRRLRTGLCPGPRVSPHPHGPAEIEGGAAPPAGTTESTTVFPGPPSPGSRTRARREALTRVRVEVEAGHVLPGRQRARQARGGQASCRGRAHAVAVHRQAGQQRRRGAVHGPRGPEVSAIHPPRECRSQPPTGPAGLAQRDLKVRPRRSSRVLGRRGLRGVHGGGGPRGLRSAAGPRPGAHGQPAVGPLPAARQSCARRRTRRLGGERGQATEETEGRKEKKGKKKTKHKNKFQKVVLPFGVGGCRCSNQK